MNTLKLCARNSGASLQSITCKVAKRWDGNAAKHLFVKGRERLPIAGNQVGMSVGCGVVHLILFSEDGCHQRTPTLTRAGPVALDTQRSLLPASSAAGWLSDPIKVSKFT